MLYQIQMIYRENVLVDGLTCGLACIFLRNVLLQLKSYILQCRLQIWFTYTDTLSRSYNI